jgi:hypothetical protein
MGATLVGLPLAVLLDKHTAAVSLWFGLGLLTLTLCVLMVTRWGQSQAIGKCVVLSVWAHLLLGVYATTVDVVFTPPPTGRYGTVYVSAVDMSGSSSDGGADSAVESATGDAKPAAESKPWERFAENRPVSTKAPDALPREAPAAVQHDERTTVAEPALPAATLPLKELAAEAPQSAEAVQPLLTGDEPRAAISQPAQAEPLATEARPQAAQSVPIPRGPKMSGPPRLAEPANRHDKNGYLESASDQPIGATTTAEAGPMPEPSAQTLGMLRSILAHDAAAGALAEAEGAATLPGAGAQGPHELPAVYRLRASPERARVAQLQGGSADTEAAVKAALAWLVKNQSPDGRWDSSDFGAGREARTLGQDRRGAGAEADMGVSGLALLAFLGAGHTHLQGDHQQTVARGLDYLVRNQGVNGNLAGKAELYAYMYCHGMAALAMSEAYAMTGDVRLLPSVRAAVAYTLAAQNMTTGGWRYKPQDVGDTSQLGWQLMVLKSAEIGGLRIPQVHRDAIARFLQSVTSGKAGGLASYRPGEQPSRTMTAEALACRQFLGVELKPDAAREASRFVLEEPPGTSPTNFYYWYYATLSLYQLQSDDWRTWNEALTGELVGQQRRTGQLSGSWDPDPIWGGYGGRVYSTALGTLCLEVYYRYLPLYVEAVSRDRRIK